MSGLLRELGIELVIDPLRPGDDVQTRERTFQFDALLFFSSAESLASANCQIELETARTKTLPIFGALLDGIVPESLKAQINWAPSAPESATFRDEIAKLAVAVRARAIFIKRMRFLHTDTPMDQTMNAAQEIALDTDSTIVAEHVSALAERYFQITDPTTRYWLALALGRAGTPQAADLLRTLPAHDHPYALEGVRQALEMIHE